MASRRSRDSLDYELQDNVAILGLSAVSRTQPNQSGSNANVEEVAAIDQQLERADGGVGAWVTLCAAFVFEALLWGEHYELF